MFMATSFSRGRKPLHLRRAGPDQASPTIFSTLVSRRIAGRYQDLSRFSQQLSLEQFRSIGNHLVSAGPPASRLTPLANALVLLQ
jgi:hypothetical protein